MTKTFKGIWGFMIFVLLLVGLSGCATLVEFLDTELYPQYYPNEQGIVYISSPEQVFIVQIAEDVIVEIPIAKSGYYEFINVEHPNILLYMGLYSKDVAKSAVLAENIVDDTPMKSFSLYLEGGKNYLVGIGPLDDASVGRKGYFKVQETAAPQEKTVEPKGIAVEKQKDLKVEMVYTVGERGPAGGLVFYDKGKYTDGWRYMELAPKETESPYMSWGGYGICIQDTVGEKGAGQKNTAHIISLVGDSDQRTGKTYAALYCDTLVYNEFDDWFLPSHEEMLLAYTTMLATGEKQQFQDDMGRNLTYWTSSADYSGNNCKAFAFTLNSHSGKIAGVNRELSSITRAVRKF